VSFLDYLRVVRDSRERTVRISELSRAFARETMRKSLLLYNRKMRRSKEMNVNRSKSRR
jgi:hypothetical protein